jgi:uncharacterized membrane protein
MSSQRNIALIVIICVVGVLLVVSPFLQQLTIAPQKESFSEMALFSSNHRTDYPSNATSGETYDLIIEVTNQLGYDADYTIEAKFRNTTQPGPDSFNHTSSSLIALESFRVSANNNQTVEVPLEVSFQFSPTGYVDLLTLNNKPYPLSTQLEYDIERNNYYGNLFFELWVYNQTTSRLEYHERYLSLWLKMNTE